MNEKERFAAMMRRSAELKQRIATELADAVIGVVDACEASLRRGGKLMFCGNGGSAADIASLVEASHVLSAYETYRAVKKQAASELPVTGTTRHTCFCTHTLAAVWKAYLDWLNEAPPEIRPIIVYMDRPLT